MYSMPRAYSLKSAAWVLACCWLIQALAGCGPEPTAGPEPPPNVSADYLLAPDGEVRAWLVIGPFPVPRFRRRPPEYSMDAALALDYLRLHGGEAGLEPQAAGHRVVHRGLELQWRPWRKTFGNGFHSQFSKTDDSAAYAFTLLHAEREARVRLSIHARSAFKVRLNGEVLLDSSGSEQAPGPAVVETRLRAGGNPLLVKMAAGRGSLDFALKVEDSSSPGRPGGVTSRLAAPVEFAPPLPDQEFDTQFHIFPARRFLFDEDSLAVLVRIESGGLPAAWFGARRLRLGFHIAGPAGNRVGAGFPVFDHSAELKRLDMSDLAPGELLLELRAELGPEHAPARVGPPLAWARVHVRGGPEPVLDARFRPPPQWPAPRLELVGDPLLDDFHDTGRVHAHNIWDMRLYDGMVYLASGDYGVNVGPTPIWRFDPRAPEAGFEPHFIADEEAVELFRIIRGRLWVPGTDPTESWDWGNLYVYDGEWTKLRTIPDAIHTLDLVEWKGGLWTCGGAVGGGFAAVSLDQGLTWRQWLPSQEPEPSPPRLNSFIPLREFLLATASGLDGAYLFDGRGWRYEPAALSPGTDNYFGGRPWSLLEFRGAVWYVFMAFGPQDSAVPLGLFTIPVHASEPVTASRAPIPEDCAPRDIELFGGELFLLCSDRESPGVSRIWKTADGVEWEAAALAETGLMARSFLPLEGMIILGSGCGRTAPPPGCTGEIWRIMLE